MPQRTHSVVIDGENCVGCVACMRACPTGAIRVREGVARVSPELCIDCGDCVEACPHDAVGVRTSTTADLKAYRHTVALPSLTLYGQFGPEVNPGQVHRALCAMGFDSCYDISWMCEMVGEATDAHLAESRGPWPRISITCPAVVRLIQIRYPDLLPHLVPVETPRELSAKLCRRRLSTRLGLKPSEIGIFSIVPCPGIIHSIVAPVGLGASYLDGAFSISEVYGRLVHAIKADRQVDEDMSVGLLGLGWAQAGGESAGMRNVNTMTVSGMRDVTYVFDHIEAGTFQSVDFIEAYICPGGCISGQLTVEGRYAASRSLRQIVRRQRAQARLREGEARQLMREHFFDLEQEIAARAVEPVRDLRRAIAARRERDALLAKLPGKDCGACGAPNCQTLADDAIHDEAKIDDCVFLRMPTSEKRGGGSP